MRFAQRSGTLSGTIPLLTVDNKLGTTVTYFNLCGMHIVASSISGRTLPSEGRVVHKSGKKIGACCSKCVVIIQGEDAFTYILRIKARSEGYRLRLYGHKEK